MNAIEFDSKVKKAEKLILVDFMAEWCAPCRALSPVLQDLEKLNQDVEVIKVDVDEQSELADRYQVRSVPTLVIIKNGLEVDRLLGLNPKGKIQSLLDIHK